uniref:Uncharacterized protein n=1 Tax=Acrobeloides nanus TaxID=290746 RepID=A0A914CL48_9BILA
MIACDNNDNHAVLVELNISSTYGLAVDWIHGLLFWTDYYLGTINVMDLNTKQNKVLFAEDINNPGAIAVDPSKGLIFWTDYGRRRIERASMVGNDRMFESTTMLFNQNFQTSVINILAAMVPYAFQKAILSTMKENHNPALDYLIHVFVLMDTRQEKNQIRVF